MEWIYEAKVVLNNSKASLQGNDNGQALAFLLTNSKLSLQDDDNDQRLALLLEEKIQAAREVAKKQSPCQNRNGHYEEEYADYDEYDDGEDEDEGAEDDGGKAQEGE